MNSSNMWDRIGNKISQRELEFDTRLTKYKRIGKENKFFGALDL